MRLFGAFVLAASLSAPMQCGGGSDPSLAMDETPGEALYELAGELKSAGNDDGWRRTLEYLIRRYPSSRFAKTAEADLEAAGASVPEADAGREGRGQ